MQITLEKAYEVLDIEPTFDKKIIKKAFKKKVTLYHPDRLKFSKGKIDENINIYIINSAYSRIISEIDNPENVSNSIDMKDFYSGFEVPDSSNYLKDIIESGEEKAGLDIFKDELNSTVEIQFNSINVSTEVIVTRQEAKEGVIKKVQFSSEQYGVRTVLVNVPPMSFNGSVIIHTYKDIDILVSIKIER